MDWRESGRLIQREFLEWKKSPNVFRNDPGDLLGRYERSFRGALLSHLGGDASKLVSYLRSDRPISSEDRNDWADVLEGKFSREPRRRPKNRDVHGAARVALLVYREWRHRNDLNGVSDWGFRDEMKDEAIRFVLEEFEPPEHEVKPEAVRELMDREKSRRN
jgi:hypothetical protein